MPKGKNEVKEKSAAQDEVQFADRQIQPISGSQSSFFEIMEQFAQDSHRDAEKWASAYDAIQSPQFFDYSLLTSKEEFDKQQDTVELYIKESHAYRAYFEGMVKNLEHFNFI